MALHCATPRSGSFRRAAIGLASAAMIGLASFAATAQQVVLTSQQCSNAISIANGIVERNQGKISKELIGSFVQFSSSRCNMDTDWKLTTKADEDAFGEFRLKLIVLRRAAAGTPALAQK